MSTACPMEHIDPVGIVESCLHHMFIGVFNDEGARRHFGFSRISPFHCNGGMPGWYLWFEDKAGAYGIVVTDAFCHQDAPSKDGPDAMVAARITVTYFPDPEEALFEAFSWFEKIARVSHLFDTSGTPTAEARRQLQDGFFTAGHIDILMTPDGRLFELVCTAAEIWVDIRPAGLALSDDKGRPFQAVQPGGRDRAVPGWTLSQFLLDKIVSGFLYCQKRSIEQLTEYQFKMPEFIIGNDNRIEKRFDLGLKGYGIQLTTAPPSELESVEGSRSEIAGWQELLAGTVYPPTQQWETVWSGRQPQASNWGYSDWSTIKNLHFHSHQNHLCTCYTDH